MKRHICILILACVLPLAFLGLAYQSFAFTSLQVELSDLDQRQRELVEINKRSLASVGLLASPVRIRQIAEDDLGLVSAFEEGITRIELGARE